MFKGSRNWFQGMNSASLCSLTGRYENLIPPRCLAPIYFLKIPALVWFGEIERKLAKLSKTTLLTVCPLNYFMASANPIASQEHIYLTTQSPNFKTFKERKSRFQGTNSARLCSLSSYFEMFVGPRNWFQGMNSASLCCRGGRYDNPIPPRFLAPIDFLKIPALSSSVQTFKESRNQFQEITPASPWGSLAGRGRYDNPIPTWILAP